MNDDRFNQLANGPLDHPFVHFRITRLLLALHYVVSCTGAAGEQALEEYCREREDKDRREL